MSPSPTLNDVHDLSSFNGSLWAALIASASDYPIPSEPIPSECNVYIRNIYAIRESRLSRLFMSLIVLVMLMYIFALSAMVAVERIRREILRTLSDMDPEDRDDEIVRLCKIHLPLRGAREWEKLVVRRLGRGNEKMGHSDEKADGNLV
ncbi:hypothetical protein WAI453_010215 [Rhynchosporium graminicola]|uniref:Uncharacterized protein n=1 Tax=Rhynchosporium graminicola TaxID=2792576 RepID=A0A1E1KFS7_9HELO|nr:uncharacterized protein RCO7_02652 [Rhynchosporium commune]